MRLTAAIVLLVSVLRAEEPPQAVLAVRKVEETNFELREPGLEAPTPYAYLVSGESERAYELSIDELLTFVAELREAAAQALAHGQTRVPMNTIEAILQYKALEPVLRIAAQLAGIPYVGVKRPTLTSLESRTIIAQVRARAKRIRATMDTAQLRPDD